MKIVATCSFLWLAVATRLTAGQSVQPSTQTPRGEQQGVDEVPQAQGSCSCDGGSVVAKLVQQLSTIQDKMDALEMDQLATKRELQATKTELQTTKTEHQAELRETKTRQESTERRLRSTRTSASSSFIRWGRKSCPWQTSLVYVGVAGGKHHMQSGSGTNPLCLTRTPQFDNTARPRNYGTLYGAEYDSIPGHHEHDVPCSVCLAPQSTTIMVPATRTCPSGWTRQYYGHLVSQYQGHYATEYVCMDGSPEDDDSGVNKLEGLLFYYVVTVCGSLPCPPYINGKVVTCVVCSK
ncbi:uncharacterized protein [Littorina saxatilis]|uniref:Short-chain collagen C4-like n=1 Tax=Littorina saxatilis TaxID=31220 RepID=A0AAN9BDG0_9CAEN